MNAHSLSANSASIILLIVCLLAVSPILRQASGTEQDDEITLENACRRDRAQSMTPMQESACFHYKYQVADKELRSVFQKAIDNIRTSGMSTELRDKWEKLLRKSQKAWMEHRKLDCNAVEYEWWGVSGKGAAMWNCYLRITKQRINELRFRYLHEEN